MTVFSVRLPFPPSVNNLFAQGWVKGRMRRFPTTRYRRWRKEALILIKISRPPTFAGPVAVRLTFTPPDARKRDVDNLTKGPLDSLVEARVLRDDSQVQRVTSQWAHGGSEPGVLIEIAALGKDAGPLSADERRTLAAVRGGAKLIGPNDTLPAPAKALVEKGYAEEIPGLFEGCPQGIVLAK